MLVPITFEESKGDEEIIPVISRPVDESMIERDLKRLRWEILRLADVNPLAALTFTNAVSHIIGRPL